MESLTKQRDVIFGSNHDNAKRLDNVDLSTRLDIGEDQAKTAIFLLADIDGVLDLKYLNANHLIVTYDVRLLTLQTILQSLSSVGFDLDNSLLCKIKNALYAYTEDTLRENLGIVESKLTRDIFMGEYQRRPHGCRDLRSTYWRRYL